MAEQHSCDIKFWVYLVIVLCLVLFAGLMSGLTLGLMSLGLVDLEVLMKSGSPQDQKHAAKIYPVVKNQHLLLCTLLLGNALAMEALPIFLDTLVNAWGAILISVTMILMFGEIFPQAICSRYGLAVGAVMTPLVRVLVILFFPITYPISKLLDYLLGKSHLALFRRAELLTLVHMHGNEAGKGGELTHDETTIITGALELTQKTAKDAMTPINSVFSVDVNANLDMKTVHLIMSEGHSRVPVYMGTPKDIVGLILVKNILTIRPEDNLPLKQITTIRRMPRVEENMPLYDILNEFQKGHSHMAAVVRYSKEKKEASNRSKSGVRLGERRLSSLRQAKVSQGVPMAVTLDISEDDDSAEDRSVIFLQKDLVVVSKSDDKGAREHGTQRGRRRERNDPGALLDIGEGSVMSFEDEEVVGIITMEDVIEELLQEEILDETDEYIDVHKTIKVNLLPHGGVQPPQQSRSSSTAISPPLPNAAVTSLSSFPQSSEPPAKTLKSNPLRKTVTQSQALMSSLAVPQHTLSNAWPQQPKVVLHSLTSTG